MPQPSTAAWTGLGAGVGVAGLVVALFRSVTGPAAEIDRYATDIDEAIKGISRNLEGAGQIAQTRDLATAVPGLAGAYLERLPKGS